MAKIELKKISKFYGKKQVLNEICLTVESGEFLSFLGPSGCGKTTTLRLIAGLETPESGQILIDGQCVADGGSQTFVPPGRRGLNMVFQSYALWPHMTAAENIAFGLQANRVTKKEARQRTQEALDQLQIGYLAERYPSEMSGGQQQRVAIARAIVTRPKILLMDEPMSNLDMRLRTEMFEVLKRLHRELKTTILYVTHDHSEAFTLSDRIAMFDIGKIVQTGTPRDLYRHPATLKIADFISHSSLNLMNGTCEADGDRLEVRYLLGRPVFQLREAAGPEVTLAINAEDISLSCEPAEGSCPFRVETIEDRGSKTILILRRGDAELTVKLRGETQLKVGQSVWPQVSPERINVFDRRTKRLVSGPAVSAGG